MGVRFTVWRWRVLLLAKPCVVWSEDNFQVWLDHALFCLQEQVTTGRLIPTFTLI